MIEVNLLPHVQRGSSAFSVDTSAMLEGAREFLGDKYLLAAIAATMISAVSMVMMFTSQSVRSSDLVERQIAAEQDSARFATILNARMRAVSGRDSIYRQLAVVKSIDNLRYTWAHLLEEIDVALPPYTWLSSVVQVSSLDNLVASDSNVVDIPSGIRSLTDRMGRTRALGGDQGHEIRFRIIGQTVDMQALTLFMKRLEASPFIQNVQLGRSDLVYSHGKEVTEFQLEASSRQPEPEYIQTTELSLAVMD